MTEGTLTQLVICTVMWRHYSLHRAAQKRDHHRRWRTRTRSAEVEGGIDNGSGEGPSRAGGEDNPDGAENLHEDFAEEQRGGENGGEQSNGAGSQEETVDLTQTTDSTRSGADEIQCDGVTPRNRKCSWAASKVVNAAMRILDAGFSEEEKKIVLRKAYCDDRIRACDPELTTAVQKVRTVVPMLGQSLKGALQTIRSTCIQGKSKVRNIVLTAAVSKGESQRMLCKALGASRYLVRKAFHRRAEVDETGENLWAGGNRKRRSDALSAEDQSSVCGWWETETTVSPNKKDVKRRRIGPKEHETHATHYLQTSQVQCSTALYLLIGIKRVQDGSVILSIP